MTAMWMGTGAFPNPKDAPPSFNSQSTSRCLRTILTEAKRLIPIIGGVSSFIGLVFLNLVNILIPVNHFVMSSMCAKFDIKSRTWNMEEIN
jgi:hypothetical protein